MTDISMNPIQVSSGTYSVHVSKDDAVIEDVTENTTYSLSRNYHFKRAGAKFEEKKESPNLFGTITSLEMQAIVTLRFMYAQEKDPEKKARLMEAYNTVVKIAGYGKLTDDPNVEDLKIKKGE